MIGVAVIGGGLAGLSAAWRLARRGVDVHLFEAAGRVGGFVGTVKTPDGFLLERGPSSIRGGRSTIRLLVQMLGLDGHIQDGRAAAKRRFIWARGRLIEVPSNPVALVKSPILTPRGKLALFSEPFVKARRDGAAETVAELFARRIGREAVDNLIDPIVTGIFAGNPARLGTDAFPGLGEVEKKYGSFFGALMKRGPAAMGGGGLYSFDEGLEILPATMGAELGERVHHGRVADRLETIAGGVRVHFREGEAVEAREVIVATPSLEVGRILADTPEARFLGAMPHPPIVRVEIGVKKADVAHALDGFGLLCASTSPLPNGAGPVLGIVFASSVFEGRAPADHHAITVLLGGTRDPDADQRSDEALVTQACGALTEVLGLRGAPTMTLVTRWSRAIPQYQPGHAAAIAALKRALPHGVQLAGNYLEGVSMDSAVATGLAAADAVRV